MEEDNATLSAYYALLFQERWKCNWDAKIKICVVCGESAVTDWKCQKWFVKFLGTTDISAE